MRFSRTLIYFLIGAFAISWTMAGLVALLDIQNALIRLVLTGLLYMWGPGIAALVVNQFLIKQPMTRIGLTVENLNWKALAASLFMPALIIATAIGVNFILGNVLKINGFGEVILTTEGVVKRVGDIAREAGQPAELAEAQMSRPVWQTILILLGSGLVAGATINLLFALGEELGWRGLMLTETRSWGFWPAQLFTGVMWGLWHAPLILEGHNYPGYTWAGVGMMVLFCVAMSPLMTLFTLRTGSVFSAAAFHGAFNALPGAIMLFTHGANPLFGGAAGVSTILALILLTGVLGWFFRKEINGFRQESMPDAE